MPSKDGALRAQKPPQIAAICVLYALAFWPTANIRAEGEPAEDFLKRLRAAGYFDIAITYLDRLDDYPGVDAKLREAIALEKAHTFIDSAVVARTATARDESFLAAEQQLTEFLKLPSHPRLSEARLQLGKLQMVRAAQLMAGKVDDEKRKAARESYLAAAKTFDEIVNNLREELKAMQGQKIDAAKEPEKAAQRDTYRAEFLQGQLNAGESRRLAARTFDDPAKDGKNLLDEALVSFTDLSDKYDGYVQGAIAMLYRGQVMQDLGDREKALDSYIRMLEQPEADPLRDAKFQATSGLIQLYLTDKEPKFDQAIDRGQPILDTARPDEKRSQSVQQLRVDLAKAYLAKAADKSQKPPDAKRAQTNGRQLLFAASKVPGTHLSEAETILADLGISKEDEVELPKAEDPKSFAEALQSAIQLYEAAEALQKNLTTIEKDAKAIEQVKELQKQLTETRAIAVMILSRGMSMVTVETDVESINQARQLLAYLLFQEKRYRESAVVGSFLALQSPGNDTGLRGGLIGLTSLQYLLTEAGDQDNTGLIGQLRDLGEYLTKTWPNDPQAAVAQGIMIRLALGKDRWDEAKQLVAKMPSGSERASYERLMGQLLWNKSVMSRQDGDEEQAKSLLNEAQASLDAGLKGTDGKLVDPEALQAALVLAKIYMRLEKDKEALETLDNSKFGPLKLVDKQGAPSETFKSDLYATELQAVVSRMTSPEGDAEKLLDRATSAMENLRKSITGDDAQAKLVPIYMGMARNIREQLDSAPPDRKTKLIDAFRVFLDRIAQSSQDPDTLLWVGQTLSQMGESAMAPGESVASGQAKDLVTSAVETFENLKANAKDLPLTVDYQLGRSYRLLGRYKDAVEVLANILTQKPMMLDAQVEAATAYEQWAGTDPARAGLIYKAALAGTRPNPNHPKKENTIWGWGVISQRTSGNPKFSEMFFDARYHVAKCRFLMGSANKSEQEMERAVSDITQVAALYPEMGGAAKRQEFDALLKEIQKRLGRKPEGLPPMK